MKYTAGIKQRKLDQVFLILFFFLSINGITIAQGLSKKDSIYARWPFIKVNVNKIQNDSTGLRSFYSKLYDLESKKKNTVSIVHIGDSHIQADFFSGTIRESFHRQFGNAGRGLIFPYRVAKTNEPSTFRSSGSSFWKAQRNSYLEQRLPVGVSGMVLETRDTAAFIQVNIKSPEGIPYSFNKMTLFHEKNPATFEIMVSDSLHRLARIIEAVSDLHTTRYRFEQPVTQFSLKCIQRNAAQNFARIYGILLENEMPGILYHTIGVNGAEYRHYNQSVYFADQLSALKPDLVIVSLGTNEGYRRGFDKNIFYLQMDSLIRSIRIKNPEANLLLTVPGDSFRKARKSRVKNPDMKIVKTTIIEYCTNNNLAYWDMYEVMGGFGSMAKWFAAGLAAKDRLHFSRKGYELQGMLLYKAINDGYQKQLKGTR